jgi:zinc protease
VRGQLAADLSVAGVLGNGMRYVVVPDESALVTAMSIAWRAGFRSDPEPMPGLAHLVEHLVFQDGPRFRRADLVALVEEAGGLARAGTRCEYTVFDSEFPHAVLPSVLALEANRFGWFAPDQATIGEELDTVRAEIAETVDARSFGRFPWSICQELLYADEASAHDGYVITEALFRATTDDCVDYFRRTFDTAEAVVVVNTPVPVDHVTEMLAETLGTLTTAGSRPSVQPKRLWGREYAVARPAGPYGSAWSWHVDVADCADAARWLVVAGVLRQAVPVQVDFGLFGGLLDAAPCEFMTVQAFYTDPSTRTEVEKAVFDAVRHVLSDSARLSRAKTAARRELRRVVDDQAGRCRVFATQQLLRGRWDFALGVLDSIETITEDDVSVGCATLMSSSPARAEVRP